MKHIYLKNLVKKHLVLTIFSSLTLFYSHACFSADKILTVLNWAEYMDPELLTKFEKEYKVKIREIYFESDDSRDGMMLENNGKGYDLLMVNGTKINQYVKRKWIAPVTIKQVKNMKHIYKRWQTAFPSASGYAVPYFWGTMGIAYRSDLVKKPILTWKQLFEPEENAKGKILMFRSARELIGIALKAKGYSINSTNENEIEEAFTLLEKQKPFIKDYGYLGTGKNSSILNGSVVASATYNGDALAVQEFSDKVKFSIPKEGTNLWVDYLAVSQKSQNKLLAYKFINFLNRPKNAA